MAVLLRNFAAVLALGLIAAPCSVFADDLGAIGITQLRAARPDLTGAGVSVAQIEATTYKNPNDPNGTAPYDPQYDQDNFEVNPADEFSGTSNPVLTYVNKVGTVSTAFNSGQDSTHGDTVAGHFYATTTGAAPGVAAVVNYNVNYFFDNVIQNLQAIQIPLAPAGAPPVSVVNQSFVFDNLSVADANSINQLYDNYVADMGTIIVTAAGNIATNDHAIKVPASAYNVIAVGDSDGGSNYGPTSDGRSKPDIVAPSGLTSFSTPYVSGVAAVMVQAGTTGAGGTAASTETAAADSRTVKALLLNGATKPAGWTHSPTQPLDPTFGAGVVNAYNSYQNLAAGRQSPTIVNASPAVIYGTTSTTTGWDLNTLTTATAADAVAHYLLNVPVDSIFTGTLDWNRAAGTVSGSSIEITGINDFHLLLYDVITGALIESISDVDNVQYLYDTDLPAGIYDLQVVKLAANAVSATDTYALAFSEQPIDGSSLAGNVQGGAAIPEGPPETVPEPSSLALATAGAGMWLTRKGIRRQGMRGCGLRQN